MMEIENQRRQEKASHVHPNQQKQFAAATLRVVLHDETNQAHIVLNSGKYQLYVDRHFFHFLQDLQKSGTCTFHVTLNS